MMLLEILRKKSGAVAAKLIDPCKSSDITTETQRLGEKAMEKLRAPVSPWFKKSAL
jgi:hypothetical protein